MSKTCVVCQREFPDETITCPDDAMLLTSPDPLIGTELDSKYRITGYIGQGGMSMVYTASEHGLDRPVALKLMKPEFRASAEGIKRFSREAVAASGLAHPNIARTFRLGIASTGTPYIAMEFLPGKNLGQLAEDPKFKANTSGLIEIFIQISSALAHAHKRGILHRDIKPSNIVLTGPDLRSAKLVDFGTARILYDPQVQRLTKTGEIVGTIDYISPEQLRGQESDERSDIYSLGRCMFDMFADPSQTVPEVIAPVIECCLMPDANARYPDADALHEALVAVRNRKEMLEPTAPRMPVSTSGGQLQLVLPEKTKVRSSKSLLIVLCCVAVAIVAIGLADIRRRQAAERIAESELLANSVKETLDVFVIKPPRNNWIRINAAIELSKRVLKVKPGDQNASDLLALCYHTKSDFVNMEKALQSMQISNRDPIALYLTFQLHYAQGQPAPSLIEDAERFLQATKGMNVWGGDFGTELLSSKNLQILGWCNQVALQMVEMLVTSDPKKALEFIDDKKKITVLPDLYRAKAYRTLLRYDRATEYLQKAQRTADTRGAHEFQAYCQYEQALLYRQQAKNQAAIQALDKALALWRLCDGEAPKLGLQIAKLRAMCVASLSSTSEPKN